MRILEGSKARIRMLIGAAGYGKTTLAEQWAANPDRRVAWVRCRRSASDIAVISRLIAAAGATVLPDCHNRLEQRLSVTPDPSREADVLAEILAEDVADWPGDAWIVIDDYHFTMEAAAAERFVEVVADQSPVQLLIASRVRPSWVSSRHLLYGDVLEVDQDLLAMPKAEIHEVFDGSVDDRSMLESFAGGWPAVIGLASQSETGRIDLDLPSTLYDFFAQEIYGALSEDVRLTLAVFASMPLVDWQLARELLGTDRANRTCRAALELGLLDDRESLLELHPLAQSFLTRRRVEEGVDELSVLLAKSLRMYVKRRDWDAAFDLIDRNGMRAQLGSLLERALDELLNEARLATLERWLESSRDLPAIPIVAIAEGELALRHGKRLQALTLAEGALRLTRTRRRGLRFRALVVAGQAAHMGSEELEALSYFSQATETARNRGERREALWGQLMCLSELEDESASDVLEELASSMPRDDPREAVREAGRRLGVEFRFGAFRSIRHATDVSQLLTLVDDPVARASFRNTYATALGFSGRYEESHREASALLDDAAAHRLEFVRPYGLTTSGVALAGLKQFADAEARCRGGTAAGSNGWRQSCRVQCVRGVASGPPPTGQGRGGAGNASPLR